MASKTLHKQLQSHYRVTRASIHHQPKFEHQRVQVSCLNRVCRTNGIKDRNISTNRYKTFSGVLPLRDLSSSVEMSEKAAIAELH